MSNERVWDEILARSPNDTEPEAPFVNFVICNLTSVYYKDSGKPVPRDRVQFLDIGCGKNARHTRWLERQGFHVTAVDVSHEALAHFHCDIADLECEPNHFACVVDIKTLCAVEKPPLDKIYSWVQPNFFFYSMCPTDRHLREEGGISGHAVSMDGYRLGVLRLESSLQSKMKSPRGNLKAHFNI